LREVKARESTRHWVDEFAEASYRHDFGVREQPSRPAPEAARTNRK